MKFRNLTTDDLVLVGVGYVEAGAEFDLPEGFNVAHIAHQPIYEPADAEAEQAVVAILAQIAADEADTADEVVPTPKGDAGQNPAPTETPDDANIPPTPEQEKN